MVDVSIENETSPEANCNRQTGGRADRQADGQANLCVGRLHLQKSMGPMRKFLHSIFPYTQLITYFTKIYEGIGSLQGMWGFMG